MLTRALPLAFIAMLGGVACAEQPMTKEAVATVAKDGISFVGNDYLISRQGENPDLLLVDVRTQSEFDAGYIPGATLIPRGMAEFQIADLVRDAEAEIILYCRTGARASLVKKALDKQGYTNVTVHEGFKTWAEAGLDYKDAGSQ